MRIVEKKITHLGNVRIFMLSLVVYQLTALRVNNYLISHTIERFRPLACSKNSLRMKAS